MREGPERESSRRKTTRPGRGFDLPPGRTQQCCHRTRASLRLSWNVATVTSYELMAHRPL